MRRIRLSRVNEAQPGPEDLKIITLARAARARVLAAEGAAVRDETGRTYAAAAVALLVCALAHWLISHRDSIATMIETLLGRISPAVRPDGYDRVSLRFISRRRRAPTALRLAKRGPPAARFA